MMHNTCKQEFIVIQIVNLFCYSTTRPPMDLVASGKRTQEANRALLISLCSISQERVMMTANGNRIAQYIQISLEKKVSNKRRADSPWYSDTSIKRSASLILQLCWYSNASGLHVATQFARRSRGSQRMSCSSYATLSFATNKQDEEVRCT